MRLHNELFYGSIMMNYSTIQLRLIILFNHELTLFHDYSLIEAHQRKLDVRIQYVIIMNHTAQNDVTQISEQTDTK